MKDDCLTADFQQAFVPDFDAFELILTRDARQFTPRTTTPTASPGLEMFEQVSPAF
jgi:hypothetical protein